MVAHLSRKDGVDIPFSRLLFTKQTEEVAKALASVMCQIVSLAQGVPPVFRIHSDAGKELVGGAFQKAVEQCCVSAQEWATQCLCESRQAPQGIHSNLGQRRAYSWPMMSEGMDGGARVLVARDGRTAAHVTQC